MPDTSLQAALAPKWQTAAQVQAAYAIGLHVLGRLVESGHVRSVKLGAAEQSRRLYCVADIDGYLMSLSEKN